MSENPVDDYLASFAGEPARYPLNKQRTWELQPHEDYADQLVIVRNKRVIAVIDRDNFDDADHIVLCVNAHAQLVEACRAALPGFCGKCVNAHEIATKLTAALAAADKEA